MNDLTKYREIRNQIRAGDVIGYRGAGMVSEGVLYFTALSHVSSVACKVRGTSPRRLIIEADEGEVNPRLLSRKLQFYNGEAWWFALRPELERFRVQIEIFLWEHVGIHYDTMGMVSNVFGRPKADPERLYCSEYTGASFYYPHEVGKKWLAEPGIPRAVLEGYLPNEALQLLLDGFALMPGDIASLPLFREPVQLIEKGEDHDKLDHESPGRDWPYPDGP